MEIRQVSLKGKYVQSMILENGRIEGNAVVSDNHQIIPLSRIGSIPGIYYRYGKKLEEYIEENLLVYGHPFIREIERSTSYPNILSSNDVKIYVIIDNDDADALDMPLVKDLHRLAKDVTVIEHRTATKIENHILEKSFIIYIDIRKEHFSSIYSGGAAGNIYDSKCANKSIVYIGVNGISKHIFRSFSTHDRYVKLMYDTSADGDFTLVKLHSLMLKNKEKICVREKMKLNPSCDARNYVLDNNGLSSLLCDNDKFELKIVDYKVGLNTIKRLRKVV